MIAVHKKALIALGAVGATASVQEFVAVQEVKDSLFHFNLIKGHMRSHFVHFNAATKRVQSDRLSGMSKNAKS